MELNQDAKKLAETYVKEKALGKASMKTKKGKKFDSVEYFRVIKEILAKRMAGMTLKQQKEFMQKVREGKIKIETP